MARPLKKETVLEKKPKAQKKAKMVLSRAPKTEQKNGKMLRLTRAKETSKKSRIRITDNTQKKEVKPKTEKNTATEKSVVVRSQMQLALLSPFRFPIPREQFVGSVARYTGVFFVVVGAFFSLLNLPYANGTYIPQQAQVTGAITTTVSTIDGGVLTDTKPNPKISIEGGTFLSAVTPITVTVPNAQEVQIILNHRETGKLIPVGNAVRIDNSTWRYYWDTTQFHDGEYRIKTAIKNVYGTYDYSDPIMYTVRNTPNDIVKDTADSPSVQEGSETITGENVDVSSTFTNTTNPQVTLEIGQDVSRDGNVPLKVSVTGATEVKLYARNTKTGVFWYLGYGKKHDDTLWLFDWDTRTVPDGVYRIHVKAKVGGKEHESPLISITIQNTQIEKIETKDTVLLPIVEIQLPNENALSGFVSLDITTSPVLGVELFVLQKNSLTPRFLGLAQKNSETSWKYVWDTKQTPNGEYALYARVKSMYGFTDGDTKNVRVFNNVLETFTKEQEAKIDTLHTIKDSLVRVIDIEDGSAPVISQSNEVLESIYIKTVDAYMETIAVEGDERDIIKLLLTSFRLELKAKLSELARAKRSGDTELLLRVQEDIESLKEAVLAELPNSVEKREIIESINAYLAEVTTKLQELTIRNEKILAEREGDDIFKDSDKDGISDYDEIHLYNTNPFAADTDGDGYIDSVEIALGYDPNDSRNEALITYESPKEAGIVREDLLLVTSITTLTFDSETDAEIPPRALIAGKGLPNSFITLYIFSTPIVVTVKTDAEGGWSYVFDKELEEGTHEVYVGITDNRGRIVAKSNPISFVKTAQAFTMANTMEGAVAQTAPESSLIPQSAMLLIASIAVVALGLILILLGIHVHGIHGRKLVMGETQSA